MVAKSTRVFAAAFAVTLVATDHVAAAPPKLPTPCLAGSCGTSVPGFVTYGAAGAAVSGSTLTVTQSSSKAILNWADFNIANGFAVKFVQPTATAAVLNKIWSGDPSVIAGQLNANGQVYLYNQNGIVFDKGSQVNVAGLTASTLALPDNLFKNGILSNNTAGNPPPAVFCSPLTTCAANTEPVVPGAPAVTPGAIAVNAGATLTATDGGRIMLLGSAVTNAGQISTPDGQTILGAATKNVYLAASTDPSLRGLLIEVDGGGTTGTVTNAGQISAPRGNVTLAGLIVNQQGTVSATTSVGENGSIYLVAGDASGSTPYSIPNPEQNGGPTAFGGLIPNNGGTLVLAAGSVTEILPDTTDTNTLNAQQQSGFIPSQVDLAGKVVAMSGNATIRAPAGNVNAYAAANPYLMVSNPTKPTADGGSIYLDSASVVDVSGLSQVAAPVTQNLVQVTLETNDLQNDPLLRDGFLHGATVTVNVSSPPSLFSVEPYAANIGSTISELSTQGGRIQLNGSGDVITRAGSQLNVSGGSIAFQGGYGPATTNLLGSDGKVYNISTAPSTIQYVGIANGYSYIDPTWGTTVKGSSQSYYSGYTQGANAGSVTVEAPQVYLRGSMSAVTVDGPYQRSSSTLAVGGVFNLGCAGCLNDSREPDFGLNGGVTFGEAIQDTLNANIVVNGAAVSATDIPTMSLLSPTQLTHSGFNIIDISSNGPVLLPVGNALTFAANGGLAVKSGESIEIAGNITGPNAAVSLQTVNTADGLLHNITVDPGVSIDVSGSWINDSPRATLQPGTTPTVINGGTVSVSAAGNVVLASGSIIDVSGGAWLNQANKLSDGSAGQISLAASAPAGLTSGLILAPGSSLLGGSLGAADGGTLSLKSGSVTVGVSQADTPGELLLTPDFFTRGGFANYVISGVTDVMIGDAKDLAGASPVMIAPLQQTLAFNPGSLLEPTGTKLGSFTQLQTLPAAQRVAANVSFAATATDSSGADIGDVTLAKDASIVTDPGASVTLAANGFSGSVRVFGSIDAPAGQITLSILNPVNKIQIQTAADPGFLANQEILLGPSAVLATPAIAKLDTLDQRGYLEGSILNGGTVSLLANKGFVVTDAGSLINVNGAAGTIDVIGSGGVTPTIVAGSGGTINIDAREGMVLQGNMTGQAATINGSAIYGAAASTLNLDLGYGYDYGNFGLANSTSTAQYPTNPRVLTLVGTAASGRPAVPFTNALQSGVAFVNTGTLMAGGFDSVTVQSSDSIAFAGSVALQTRASLILDAPAFAAGPGAQVALSAPYVAVGNYLNQSDYFDLTAPSPNAGAVLSPVSGTATLNVGAQLIDIRGISGWSGFAVQNFTSTGDIRLAASANTIGNPPPLNVTGNTNFEGALNTSATLNLQSAQLYPTTATGFSINDVPTNSATTSAQLPTVVTISAPASAAVPAVPLSAGGSLSISATEITQSGVLRAPFGQLSLNGQSIEDSMGNVAVPGSVTLTSGSLTSVSSGGLTLPYGATSNGTQWTYSPAGGETDVIATPPAKQISLTGASVATNSGAKVDLSGGGDLYAYEFIAGQGGAVDVLDPNNLPMRAGAANVPSATTVYSYAIVPSLSALFAPSDAQYSLGSNVTPGQTITLSGVPGLTPGTYALLPARYALLPDAYAIRVVQSNSGVAAGSSVKQSDGSYIVAARLGNASAGVQDSLTSTVLIASDSTVRTHAQYTDTYGNAFFSAAASASQTAANESHSTAQIPLPSLPADAGELSFSVTSGLSLNGSLSLSPGSYTSGTDATGKPLTQSGRGGEVSVTAQNLVVVDSVTPQSPAAAGAVQLDVQQLDKLNAQTLLLGASVSNTTAGELLSLGPSQTPTQTVELKNTTALTAPQVILAALDSVTVDSGAQLTANNSNGGSSPAAGSLLLPGGGALLRVSSGPAATLVVDPTTLSPGSTGSVTIGNGANVQAAGSLLLYGTNTTTVTTGAQIDAPAVSLYSSVASLGNVPAGATGLLLTPQLLSSFTGLTDLTIGSSSLINLYGALQLGTPGSSTPNLSSITFDTGSIAAYGSGDKVFQAGNLAWINSTVVSAAPTSAPDGAGSLQFVATASGKPLSGQVTIGAGDKILSGVTAFGVQAAGDIVFDGVGTLSTASASTVPVNFTAAALIASAEANQAVTTNGAVTITPAVANSALVLPSAGLGAKLVITGGSIAQNGTVNLPAGSIALTANTGDLVLGAGSLTGAAGASQGFTVTDAVAAGGVINLTSVAGNVSLGQGATLDLSGATSTSGKVSGGAGTLNISAPQGTFAFASGILKANAAATEAQGNFNLDVGSGLSATGFSALNTALADSGFTGAINLRSRTDGSVSLAGVVQAASFELSADRGSIDVLGSTTIDTRGGGNLQSDGGLIALWAGTGLTLEAGAQLLADAGAAGPQGTNGASLAGHGGNVTLGTASGQIALIAGSGQRPTTISMHGGGDATTDGTLTLRAPRTPDNTNLLVSVDAGVDVVARKPVIVEGFKTYTATELGSGVETGTCGAGGFCDIADQNGLLFTDAATFVAAMATPPVNLAGLSTVQVRPGIEIDSPLAAGSRGDLTLDGSTAWDLGAWNAALGAPVNLTLRAAGNLVFATSLSDGFTNNGAAVASWTFGEPTGSGAGSASYRLVAGADLTAANPLAVAPQPVAAPSVGAPPNRGNVIITPGNLIRTGSGSIDIGAGGDVLLGYNFTGYDPTGTIAVAESDPLASVIYTAGMPSPLSAAQSALFTATNLSRRGGGTPAYPTEGGNITVAATDDIRSAVSGQLVSDWLWRRAATSGTFAVDSSSTWWVMFNDFQQGIGALGGGNVSVTAGRDIVNTSAVIPTTGRLLLPASGGAPVLSDLVLTGGGNLHVRAGGDIVSGVFEDDWGDASLTAGGAVKSGTDSTFGQGYPASAGMPGFPGASSEIFPVFAVGNGVFDVSAAGAIAFAGVTNSTTLPISLLNQKAVGQSAAGAFYAYAPNGNPATLNVESAGGSVTLNNDSLTNVPIVALSNGGVGYEASSLPEYYLATYPSTVNVAALTGNVNLGESVPGQTTVNSVNLTLFPGATGNLSILAGGSINNDGQPFSINMSEVNPNTVPTVLLPSSVAAFTGITAASLPLIPLHQADATPISVVADSGNIASSTLVFPKAANVLAAGSLSDLNYAGKNLNPADVTLIAAGGEITYSTLAAPVTNDLIANSAGIQVAGPGYVEVLAGGSINLGDGGGIVTSGNLGDSRLPSVGASMVVGAGFGSAAGGGLRQPANQAFINTYLAPNSATQTASAYAPELIDYVQQLNPGSATTVSYGSALSAFEGLTAAQQLPLLASVLNSELSATGLAHTLQGASYDRGYAAINTLFPTKDAQGNALAYNGDLNMFYSQLKTQQGGDIDLLVPGGSVVVGEPNPPANLNTVKGFNTASGLPVPGTVNLGILVLAQGAVEGFADQSFVVNQSRILTLEGGDIILWASNGNIDAGKGAKSASGSPPPTIQTDANGNSFVDPSNSVSGSGIGQLLTVPGLKAGLVNLIAPKGDVNAGDAGIRVAGNLNIAAVQVIGAGNISVVGTSSGVPVSQAGALAGALSGANALGDSSKSAVNQLAQDLGTSANYQQLTDNLAPTFISVKMFCLGVECETK